jgi:hypothetical protein
MSVGCLTQAGASCPIQEVCGRGAIRKSCGNLWKCRRCHLSRGAKSGPPAEGESNRQPYPRSEMIRYALLSSRFGEGLRLGAAVGAESGPGDAAAVKIQADAVTFVPNFLAMGYFPADRNLVFE